MLERRSSSDFRALKEAIGRLVNTSWNRRLFTFNFVVFGKKLDLYARDFACGRYESLLFIQNPLFKQATIIRRMIYTNCYYADYIHMNSWVIHL